MQQQGSEEEEEEEEEDPREQLEAMSRKELLAVAKENGVKASGTSESIIAALLKQLEHGGIEDMETLEYSSDADDGDAPPKLVRFPDNFETSMSASEDESDPSDEEADDSGEDSDMEVRHQKMLARNSEKKAKAEHKKKSATTEAPARPLYTGPAYDENDKKRTLQYRGDAKRLLTSEDFALLAQLKDAQAKRQLDPRYRKKAKFTSITAQAKEDDDSDHEDGGVAASFTMTADGLMPRVRTGKQSKVEKLDAVVTSRKELKWTNEGHKGGLTNTEQKRKKQYMMVRKGKKSVVGKTNKSNSDHRWDKMHAREQQGREKRKRRRT